MFKWLALACLVLITVDSPDQEAALRRVQELGGTDAALEHVK